MKALWTIFLIVLREQPVALWRGAALTLIVLLMGVALLGLSGWFITAAAAAGLAGTGAVFDVFRPSAMVRFLALGRAAARYGERVLTHDATLRALEAVRLRLLSTLVKASYQKMVRLRGSQVLTRLTADIDALDGVSLRLVLPLAAGLLAQLTAFGVLWALVSLPIALWILAGHLLGMAAIFWWAAHSTIAVSRRAEAASQAFQARFIDLIRARRDLTVYGRLRHQADYVLDANDRRVGLQRVLDRADRLAGAAIQALVSVVAGGVLWLGIVAVQSGSLEPAFAALGFFAALALVETIAPLRRGATDLGRMVEAARRVSRDVNAIPVPTGGTSGKGTSLCFENVTLTRPGSSVALIDWFSLQLGAGQSVALTGPSGAGKSTLLLAAAALHPVASGMISVGGLAIDGWDDSQLRNHLTLVPQRSMLMAGTIAEALTLAAPDCDAGTMRAVLEAVQLWDTVEKRGGLSASMTAGGEGFSGGEIRRLALARALLRRPDVLLLDEPTEGLDEPTADRVLTGIRDFLPDAAILIAAHRSVETRFADRVIALKQIS